MKLATTTLFFVLLLALGCKREDPEPEPSNSCICTQDCPGVCGADGNNYCNECEAECAGTTVAKYSPCD